MRVRALVVLMCVVAARPVEAQSLRDRLEGLFRFGDCGQPLCLTVSPTFHGLHYLGSAVEANRNTLTFLTDALGTTLGSIPISATTSGATFRFVEGAPVATATSAGPIFAERAQTLGRGRFLVGANTTRIAFDDVRGLDMDDLAFNFSHQDITPAGLGQPAYEYDIVSVRPSIRLNLQSTAVFLTYGLADRVDVGVAVPIVSASLRSSSIGAITNAVANPTGAHRFGTTPGSEFSASAQARGSHVGLGDVAVRAKYRVSSSDRVGVALLGDARLPTGDEDNFTGTGDLALRALAVVSGRAGWFSPHLNAGYAFRGSDRNGAALVTAGFDGLVAPWMTLAADVISELQVGDSKLTQPGAIVFADSLRTTVPSTNIPDRRDDLVSVSLGGKFVVSGITLVANGLLPVGKGGVRSTSGIYTVGIERTF